MQIFGQNSEKMSQGIVSEILCHLDIRNERVYKALKRELSWSNGKSTTQTLVLSEVSISLVETKKYIERRRLEGWKTKNDTKHKQTETF